MWLLFFLCWVIFAGAVTPEIIVFGVIIASAIFYFQCKFMNHSWKKERRLYHQIFWFFRYGIVLVIEILKANIGVMQLILSPDAKIHPKLVRIHTNLRSDRAKVLLANAITLTPGTITVTLKGDELVVHCLDGSMAEGMEDSIFVEMLTKLEEGEESK